MVVLLVQVEQIGIRYNQHTQVAIQISIGMLIGVLLKMSLMIVLQRLHSL